MITVWGEIRARQQKNEAKHGKGFNSTHEMYAVLKEEIEEYLESVAAKSPDREELLDVAAVLVSACEWLNCPTRSIESLCDDSQELRMPFFSLEQYLEKNG